MNYTMMLDFVEMVIGAYVIFLAFQMKNTGKLTNNALISKNIDLNKAPDPAGYIKATFVPDIVCGIVLLLCGGASRLTDGTSAYENVQIITMILSVVIIFSFGYVIVKAQQKYLEGK